MADSTLDLFDRALEEECESTGSSGTSSLVCDNFGTINHSSDAATAYFPHRFMTKDAVSEELETLDYYEKVSLALLLYDDINYALQSLRTAERARLAGSLLPADILSAWICHQREGIWRNKLLEALCIIQNYQMLTRLGCDVNDEKTRFLPDSPESSLFVNCIRKALYHVCEELSKERLEELLRRVKADFEELHIGDVLETYDAQYMEVNILNWSCQGYISLGDKDGRGVDLRRLITQLKVMEEFSLHDILESAVKATVNASVGYRPEMPVDNVSLRSSSVGSLSECRSEPSSISQSQHSVASTFTQVNRQLGDTYPVNPNKVGFCVIINQKNFYRECNPYFKNMLADHELETRLGTDVDRDRLSETFTSLGFDLWIGNNLTHHELLGSVRSALQELVEKEHSCFILCILSHGARGAVYGTNSVPVYVEALENEMKHCTYLIGRPKILIIQACQGQIKHDAEDIAADGPAARSTDFMTFWSTVPGYASFRHEINGTWFIQALCQELLQAGPTDDLVGLFVNVNRTVNCQTVSIEGRSKTMVPIFSTTFTRNLVLPLHPNARIKVTQRMFERHVFNALLKEFIELELEQKRKKKGFFRI